MTDNYIVIPGDLTGKKLKTETEIDDSDGLKKEKLVVSLEASDIQIGQVELKDADSDSQANIKAADTARTTDTVVLATQHIDDAGNVGGVQGDVASGAADSGNPVKVGGKYNATPPTLDDGDRGDLELDANGNTKVTLATQIAGEDLTNDVMKVEQRFSYETITLAAPTTTVVKSGAGFLHAIDFTAIAAGVITIYDNISAAGTPVRIITSPATLLQNEINKVLDISFATGLTIVTSVAAQDILVSYR